MCNIKLPSCFHQCDIPTSMCSYFNGITTVSTLEQLNTVFRVHVTLKRSDNQLKRVEVVRWCDALLLIDPVHGGVVHGTTGRLVFWQRGKTERQFGTHKRATLRNVIMLWDISSQLSFLHLVTSTSFRFYFRCLTSFYLTYMSFWFV